MPFIVEYLIAWYYYVFISDITKNKKVHLCDLYCCVMEIYLQFAFEINDYFDSSAENEASPNSKTDF